MEQMERIERIKVTGNHKGNCRYNGLSLWRQEVNVSSPCSLCVLFHPAENTQTQSQSLENIKAQNWILLKYIFWGIWQYLVSSRATVSLETETHKSLLLHSMGNQENDKVGKLTGGQRSWLDKHTHTQSYQTASSWELKLNVLGAGLSF